MIDLLGFVAFLLVLLWVTLSEAKEDEDDEQ